MLIEIQTFPLQVSDQGVRVEPKNLHFKQTIQMTSLVEHLAGGALYVTTCSHTAFHLLLYLPYTSQTL